MIFEKSIFPKPFQQWIWKDNENKVILVFSFLSIISLYYIFLKFYPHPNFLPDSYSYLEAAKENWNINMWPVGYSKFLRFLSVFDHTDQGLFFVQYFILELSTLFFLLTIRYLLNIDKWTIRIISIILVPNPLWLYVSNFVSSDALFASVSLLWLTTLIWMIYHPEKNMMLLHGLILFFVFSIRYNALYYPFITGIVLFINNTPIKSRLAHLVVVLLPVCIFFGYTVIKYKEKTNTVQFSPFGGWQIASNALYMYAHVSPRTNAPVPSKFKSLHNITVKHLDSLNHLRNDKRPDNELGIYYLWDGKAPLKGYLTIKYQKDSITPYLKRWADVAPLYNQYGLWLIKQFPGEFAKYYIWPNLINYYVPNPEFLGYYNMGTDSVNIRAVEWFGYKTNKIHSFSKDKKISLTQVFPPILAIINIFFFTGLLGFIFLNGLKEIPTAYKTALYLFISIWAINLLFSVLASPIVLRYQVFPFIFTTSFASIFLSFMVKKSFPTNEETTALAKNDLITAI